MASEVGIGPVGILGHGVVGGAIARHLAPVVTVHPWDPAMPRLGTREAALACPVVFVAAPTPTGPDGEHADCRCVEDAVRMVAAANPGARVVILSTVPMDLCDALSRVERLPVELYHQPEFLTERIAALDVAMAQRIVIGCGSTACAPDPVLEAVYRVGWPGAELRWVPWETSALLKYGLNAFGAVKVALCNELAQVAEAVGVRWWELRELMLGDGRVGREWTLVPGPDGELGFGGACLPKDTRALAAQAEALGVRPLVMRAALAKSAEVRGAQGRPWPRGSV